MVGLCRFGPPVDQKVPRNPESPFEQRRIREPFNGFPTGLLALDAIIWRSRASVAIRSRFAYLSSGRFFVRCCVGSSTAYAAPGGLVCPDVVGVGGAGAGAGGAAAAAIVASTSAAAAVVVPGVVVIVWGGSGSRGCGDNRRPGSLSDLPSTSPESAVLSLAEDIWSFQDSRRHLGCRRSVESPSEVVFRLRADGTEAPSRPEGAVERDCREDNTILARQLRTAHTSPE
eukprot:CAMPEP_0206457140 /NCGR_PEP_ID=MMETSP0324_2-20121206/22787_1 /ASSEMBLY_ACC=CAM_ASM_000836 /TAXON_ID=2866 /ORGANISM="Crypthecodinium cohnii, Strain Seligo" /LENGTH=228 /DNA_ID=CAMNT_0053928211 /DNA_START=559 /DNA_END=1246 /DNA_ORIENTATION=-